MADCPYTCFDRVLNQVQECPEDKLKELYEVITEYGLRDILDFGIENKLFTERQAETLYDGIIMWEDLDGNYYEEDEDKMNDLLDKMGVEPEKLAEWQKEYDER